jgi:two-component system, cell cycle response regulator DivK
MRDAERAALERLDRLGGPSLTRELTGLYLEQTWERLDAARAAVRAGDASGVAHAAHAIRSSSAQLGATEIVALCDALEDDADRGELSRAAEDLSQVADAFEAFATWLATATSSADDRVPGVELRGHTSSSAHDHSATIAVIEDNVDNRLLIDAILGDLYALDEYATGAEALALMPSRPPALVLLDVSLPGLDGLDVLARIRDDPALGSVPVVAVTAHAMAGDRERYLAAGFDAYVPKPIVDERVLIDTIERLLPAREDASAAEDHQV